ncbi:DUF86 domain-containing protein [Fictibacillus gelatini]|uniref:DUF86 domain-containing protein n=1 Tax=Fictibacillus gelatini TaxID=225985 RepID=UPI0004032C07|nr:DUF86 domain-containing protein [Fictibacillus gelatini]
MYFVDRKKIEQKLQYIKKLTGDFANLESVGTSLEQLALERIGHLLIESILDVGNGIIDGFIMRDPGSYEDIIDILHDENVIDEQAEKSLKQIIALRKSLVQDFCEIDHGQLIQTLKENLHAVSSFPANVREYLENELGPVSAFLPDEK